MLWALLAVIAGQPLTVFLVLRHLGGREEQTAGMVRDAIRSRDAQIADLCQRIQAPDVAVAQHVAEQPAQTGPLYVPYDDDEAFAEAMRQANGG